MIKNGMPCIYFYMKENIPLYIGKTNQLETRHKQHIRNRAGYLIEFDILCYQYYTNDIILPAIELFYINLYNPKYNKTGFFPQKEIEDDFFWRILEYFFIEEHTVTKKELETYFNINTLKLEKEIAFKIQNDSSPFSYNHKGGRSKIPDEIILKIYNSVLDGTYPTITLACQAAKVSRAAYYKRKKELNL